MVSQEALLVRQRLATDFHRPRYHFLAPSNWMNDPNGVIQWQGTYHLFYQYNPYGPLWGNMHWGHASSEDLIHWTDLPIALGPNPEGYDASGIFSGCAVNNNGTPTILYTGTSGERCEIQVQCMATSDDGLLTVQKYVGNPIIGEVPTVSGQKNDFRDPFVWREEESWYMVVGSQIKDVGGAVFLYKSHNLTDWEYLNTLLAGDIHRNGAIWECPNFFKLGNQWVLIISSHTGSSTGNVIYFVGGYENHHFTPVYEGVLEHGCLYAPLTMLDDKNRRLLFGWIRESRSNDEQEAAGWSGAHSIPRVLFLDSHNRLLMTPVPELEALRGSHHQMGPVELVQEITPDVNSLNAEIMADIVLQSDGTCTLSLACAPNSVERIDIAYEAQHQTLIVRSLSSEGETAQVWETPHTLAADEALQLHILLDGSVVEIIANQRTSVTGRVYPSHPDCSGIRVSGANAQLRSLNIWQMSSIWQ